MVPDRGRRPVPPSLYSRSLLETFAAGEHQAFLERGGRSLRPRVARSLALARLQPGLVVADIGCGRGEAVLHCARRGATVTAVDFSRDSLELTRQTLRVGDPRAVGRVRLVQSDAGSLPLGDRSADRVLLLDVVEHLHGWQLRACLREVRRILRPGGFVVIHTLPNRWALRFAYPLLRLVGSGLPSEPRSDYERVVHVNEQDPRRLSNALRRSGLEARVWVEEWSTLHAARSGGRAYPDGARARGYEALQRPGIRRLARLAMSTPAANLVGNDVFALAWRFPDPPPPRTGRMRAFR